MNLCPVCQSPLIRANDGTAWFCRTCFAEGREPLPLSPVAEQMPPKEARGAVRVTCAAETAKIGRPGNKYRAVRTEVDGVMFDSKREAARFCELQLLDAAGKISDLRTKCRACVFDLTVNGVQISRFTADFVYTENGQRVVEDLKSGPTRTRAYVMRKKLMLACHGIEIRETR